jgi:hypothetical protein
MESQMTNAATVLAVAAVVYDQDTHSEADMEFLFAIAAADREWLDALNAANLNFGGGSEAWQAVKNLATRSRDKAYADALAALEAHDDADDELLQAAE